MISRIDHISIAVKDIDRAKNFFCNVLGAIPGSSDSDSEMKFYWEIFSLGDLSRIELITPTGEGSFLDNFMKDRGEGAHHLTLQVPDISTIKEDLRKNSVPFFEGKDYGGNWKELFIHPKDAFGVLIQIAEFNASDWISPYVNLPEKNKWLIEKDDPGYVLLFAHPGGGRVEINLSRDELEMLIKNLKEAL